MSVGRMTLRRRARPRPALPRRLRLEGSSPGRRRLLVALAVLLVLVLFGAWLLFRDSSFVSVQRVSVTGDNGPDAAAIRSALDSAARKMTTLDVQVGQLRSAVSAFPEVKGLRVSTQLPHRLTIHVIEQLPVAVIRIDARQIPVAGDGTILRAGSVTTPLPVLPVTVPPVGAHLTEPSVSGDLAVLAAAPYRLVSRLSRVERETGHGLVAQIRDGPAIYFGPAVDLAAKWIAAAEVLADPSSSGASYIDVTVPTHPAAGGGSSPAATSAGSAGASSSGPSSSGTAASSPGASSSGTAASSSGASSSTTAASSSGTAPSSAGTTSAPSSGVSASPDSPAGGAGQGG